MSKFRRLFTTPRELLPIYIYIYIYIFMYVYCHPQTEYFVASQSFSVVRHRRSFKLRLRPTLATLR